MMVMVYSETEYKAPSIPLVVSRFAICRLYEHSIAGKMGRTDYEGSILRVGDTVMPLRCDGKPMQVDKEIVFQMPLTPEDCVIDDKSALARYALKVVSKIQCKLDREIFNSYPCETEGEFIFAGQLFCTLEQSSISPEARLTFQFVYGHRACP